MKILQMEDNDWNEAFMVDSVQMPCTAQHIAKLGFSKAGAFLCLEVYE